MRRVFRRVGARHTLAYLLSRLLSAASGDRVRLVKYLIVAQPIGAGALDAVKPDRSTEIVQAGPQSELARYFPRPDAVIRRRFASGASCYCALVKKEFAGFLWILADRYEEDEVRCTYVLEAPQQSVWDFDVYIEPKFRLSRTLARLWHAVDARLNERGVRWSFSRISAFNAESLAAHAKLGIIECQSATFLVIGQFQLSFLSQRPYVHASFSACRRPAIRLDLPAIKA